MSITSIINNIEKEIEERFYESDTRYCGFVWFYKNHLCVVKDTALKLANILDANKEIVHLAAILHDIGYITDPENHIESSIKEAKLLMKKYGINDGDIEKVIYCIQLHDKLELPITLEARIIQVADAIAYSHPEFLSSMKKIKGKDFNRFLEKKRKKIKWALGWNC